MLYEVITQLYVNGVAAGPVYTANLATCSWKKFIYNTNAGTNTLLNLELINENTVASGNDFALRITSYNVCYTKLLRGK